MAARTRGLETALDAPCSPVPFGAQGPTDLLRRSQYFRTTLLCVFDEATARAMRRLRVLARTRGLVRRAARSRRRSRMMNRLAPRRGAGGTTVVSAAGGLNQVGAPASSVSVGGTSVDFSPDGDHGSMSRLGAWRVRALPAAAARPREPYAVSQRSKAPTADVSMVVGPVAGEVHRQSGPYR